MQHHERGRSERVGLGYYWAIIQFCYVVTLSYLIHFFCCDMVMVLHLIAGHTLIGVIVVVVVAGCEVIGSVCVARYIVGLGSSIHNVVWLVAVSVMS